MYSCSDSTLIASFALAYVALSPGPSPLRRGLVHTVCTCVLAIFHKKKLHALIVRMRNIITNHTFQIDSSGNLTCRILLEYYFSDISSKLTLKQKGNKSICQKNRKNTYLSLYITCSSSVLNMTSLYNRNSHDKALLNSVCPEKQPL